MHSFPAERELCWRSRGGLCTRLCAGEQRQWWEAGPAWESGLVTLFRGCLDSTHCSRGSWGLMLTSAAASRTAAKKKITAAAIMMAVTCAILLAS